MQDGLKVPRQLKTPDAFHAAAALAAFAYPSHIAIYAHEDVLG